MSIPQICFTVHGKEICMPIYQAYFFAGGRGD
jgi:hypothetical protein